MRSVSVGKEWKGVGVFGILDATFKCSFTYTHAVKCIPCPYGVGLAIKGNPDVASVSDSRCIALLPSSHGPKLDKRWERRGRESVRSVSLMQSSNALSHTGTHAVKCIPCSYGVGLAIKGSLDVASVS